MQHHSFEPDRARLNEAVAVSRVLVVSAERTLRESCAHVLQQDGHEVTHCARGDEARRHLQRGAFDVVVVDHSPADGNGTELIQVARECGQAPRVIVVSGDPSISSSEEVLRVGAWDYLPKPFTAMHLRILCNRAARATAPAAGYDRAVGSRSVQAASGRHEAPTLLGTSPAFLHAVELARRVARTDASVFLTGESGTGKEMFAQFIHHHSRRNARPCVAVNCAALPESLLESEMFGHVKGAFTGAVRDKPGLLETADGGTLFLDELTEMSLTIQAKLLRVIQDGLVRRVGSEKVNARVDVRFVAATNRDPMVATTEGALRQDLYYRLGVVPIKIPPLRERVEDIPLLAEHFLRVYWARHRSAGSPIPTLGSAALRALEMREWQGNVRELQNVIEHAVVLAEPGREIGPADLPDQEGSSGAPRSSAATLGLQWERSLGEEGYHEERERVLVHFERSYLNQLVVRAGSNMSRAAKLAGVDRTTLYRLMEKHRLCRDSTFTAVELDTEHYAN